MRLCKVIWLCGHKQPPFMFPQRRPHHLDVLWARCGKGMDNIPLLWNLKENTLKVETQCRKIKQGSLVFPGKSVSNSLLKMTCQLPWWGGHYIWIIACEAPANCRLGCRARTLEDNPSEYNALMRFTALPSWSSALLIICSLTYVTIPRRDPSSLKHSLHG